MSTDTSKKAQHKRFVEKSRELGCDNDQDRFNDRLKKIARSSQQQKSGKDTTRPA